MAVSKGEGGGVQNNQAKAILVLILNGMVSVTLSDPPCQDGNGKL